MLRSETINGEDYSPKQQDRARDAISQGLLQGNIQKISQEGSKNTYVIIVNKDCIKSESSKGPPVIKHPQVPQSNHGRFISHRPILEADSPEIINREHLANISENQFDSPTFDIDDSRVKPQLSQTEDVRLNLSNINYDEYDSNLSSSNVFLKPEFVTVEQDSAIEADISQNSLYTEGTSHTRSFFCQKSNMNTYVVPSPLAAVRQPQKMHVDQHKFPMISPQCVGNRQSSKLAYNTPVASDKLSSNQAARKIFLVTPSSTQGGTGNVLKKSVAYTNDAVPVMGKPHINSFNSPATLMPKTNPKAVPMFRNISPINQSGKITQLPASSFVPINPSVSPVSGASLSHGPFTSTPIVDPRLQHLKQESSSHRPVYIIPSPFARRNSSNGSETPCNNSRPQPASNLESPVIMMSPMTNSTFNNSSGFISASSSLEMADTSSSFESVTVKNRKSAENGENPVIEIVIENVQDDLHTDPEAWSRAKKTVSRSRRAQDKSGRLKKGVKKESIEDIADLESALSIDSENDPCVSSSQESETSDVSEKVGLNRSLTNIQWLKGMQLKDEKHPTSNGGREAHQTIQWMTLTAEELKEISIECGREKRPPFSYMSMIEMALYSRADRKMMLKEICTWIEAFFPYYKYTAKPGWKNSIRHNLSLYNIFVREPSKRHGSYWTIKPDLEPKMKQYKEKHTSSSPQVPDVHQSAPTLPCHISDGVIPIIPMYSSMGQLSAIQPPSFYLQNNGSKKKGPPPILPRPSQAGTTQAFALVPISSVGQSFCMPSHSPQQPVFVNLANSGGQISACPSPVTEMSAAVASIEMSRASPLPTEQFGDMQKSCREQVLSKKSVNIVKQAWLDSMETASSVDSDLGNSTDVTNSNEIASSNEYSGCRSKSKSKRPRDKPSLPKPTMYKTEDKKSKLIGSKRRKLQQKERPLLNDSSDEEEDNVSKFISNLEKDLSNPVITPGEIRQLLTTSTPLKPATDTSPQLPSPIRGLTPLRNTSLFDGSFLETLGDRKALGLSPDLPLSKKNTLDESPNLNGSPNASLLDFNVLPFSSPVRIDGSPDSNTSSHNLSRFLSEYGLDSNTFETVENFPELNWSVMQQIVDKMDSS